MLFSPKFRRAPGSLSVVQGVQGIEGARHADQGLTPEQQKQLADAAGQVTQTIIDAVTGKEKVVVVPAAKKEPPYLMITGLLVLGFVAYKKL